MSRRIRVRVQFHPHPIGDTAWAILAVLVITGILAQLWMPLGVIFLAVIGVLWAFVAYARHLERRTR